jgi:hypothetical protein
MAMIRSFFALSPGVRWLLIKSATLLIAVRLGLWLLPFHMMRRILSATRRRAAPYSAADARRIAQAVKTSSKYVPMATCLTQALTTMMMLGGRQGILRVGVARGKTGSLLAHAWVEIEGRVVIGWREDLSAFTVLSPLEDRIV